MDDKDEMSARADAPLSGRAHSRDMTPIKFKSSIVVEADGKIVIALFDGAHSPSTVAVLRCSREAAVALRENLSSALSAKPF